MICYKDKTFCASPNCKNECGRKITLDEHMYANEQGLYVAYAYFCGKPEKLNENTSPVPTKGC